MPDTSSNPATFDHDWSVAARPRASPWSCRGPSGPRDRPASSPPAPATNRSGRRARGPGRPSTFAVLPSERVSSVVPATVVRSAGFAPRTTTSCPAVATGSTDRAVPLPGAASAITVDWPGTRSTRTRTRSPERSYAATRETSPVQASSSHGTADRSVAVSQTSWADPVEAPVLGVPGVGEVVEVDVALDPTHVHDRRVGVLDVADDAQRQPTLRRRPPRARSGSSAARRSAPSGRAPRRRRPRPCGRSAWRPAPSPCRRR